MSPMSSSTWLVGVAWLAACLAGCYSPSIESCRLTCAADEACPSGLSCVNGMCAAAGDTCRGDDAGLPGTCGDTEWVPGEICFGAAITTGTELANIHQLQLANVDDDPELEIVLVAGTALHAFDVKGNALVPQGALVANAVGAVRAVQLDNTPTDELVIVDTTNIRVMSRQGETYHSLEDATLDADSDAPVVVRAVRLPGPERHVVAGNVAKVAMASINDELEVTVHRSAPFEKVIDIAAGPFDSDPEDELAIVTSSSIEVWDANLETAGGATISISGISRVAFGDVSGDAAHELVYAKAADEESPGELGVARIVGGTISFGDRRQVEDLVGALEVGDVDGDNRSDLVSLRAGSTRAVVVWLGGDTLGAFREIEAPITPRELAPPVDLTGDGVPDLVITDGSTLALLPSNP